MSTRYIKEKDTVSVNINCALMTLSPRALVLHIPRGTGDFWIFSCLNTGELIYVSEGCTVTKLNKVIDGENK